MIIDKVVLLPIKDKDDNIWNLISESQEREYFDNNNVEVEVLAYNETDNYMLIKTNAEWSIRNGFVSEISKTPILRFECEKIGVNLFKFTKYDYYEFLIFEREVV